MHHGEKKTHFDPPPGAETTIYSGHVLLINSKNNAKRNRATATRTASLSVIIQQRAMHLSYRAPAISALSRAAASAAPAASCVRDYNELLSDSRVVRVPIVTRLGVTSSDSEGPTTQAAVVPHSARATAAEWPKLATGTTVLRHLWMNRPGSCEGAIILTMELPKRPAPGKRPPVY